MRLFLLRMSPDCDWSLLNFTAAGFVVRAEDEQAARRLGGTQSGSEGEAVWMNPAETTCEDLGGATAGGEFVILRDLNGVI